MAHTLKVPQNPVNNNEKKNFQDPQSGNSIPVYNSGPQKQSKKKILTLTPPLAPWTSVKCAILDCITCLKEID